MSRRYSICSTTSNSSISYITPLSTLEDSGESTSLKSRRRQSVFVNNSYNSQTNSVIRTPRISICDELTPKQLEIVNDKQSHDLFIKAYNRARRKSVVISHALDDDVRNCLTNSIFQSKSKCVPGTLNECLNPLMEKLEEYENNHKLSALNSPKLIRPKAYVPSTGKPRFGSLLSKDGQFALLKSYEDVIANELQVVFPELKNRVPRTRIESFTRKENANMKFNNNNTSTFNLLNKQSSNNVHSRRFGSTSSLSSSNNSTHSHPSSPVFDANESVKSDDSNKQQTDYEKQLQVSHQLEFAMDMLDNLKEIKDHKIKSSSFIISNDFDPLGNYNKWRNEWNELIEMN